MLWLYEGQTEFWSFVLAARSGIMTRDQVMDVFARLAAKYVEQSGRSWRPLADTGNDAIMTRELVDVPWPSWHRALNDSYSEADLMWLEVDGMIRELSGEKHSLDDFARIFFTGGGESPSLYDFGDVVAGLEKVQSYDWSAFLKARLHNTGPSVPTEWLRHSGYKLVFTDTPTAAFADHERKRKRVDLSSSIGLVLSAGTPGEIKEVIWGSPAFDAALVQGASILKVNGRKYEPALLLAAIRDNRGGANPITLTVSSHNRTRTASIDYRGGLRFPRLERIAGSFDRLGRTPEAAPCRCGCGQPMTAITVIIGDERFQAHLRNDLAPNTCSHFRSLLPWSEKIVHVRWSGEGCWIPLGDLDVGIGYENATSHPRPGEFIFYPGGLSEAEILLAYGGVSFASKAGRARR